MSYADPAIADFSRRGEALAEAKRHFPKRDFVPLLLTFVMTIVVPLVGGEAAAWSTYVQADNHPAFYVRGFLRRGDPGHYVRSPLTAQWRRRDADVGDLLGRITASTTPADVPVLLFYSPERPQAALAAEASALPDIDPLALGDALGAEASKHSARFFDTTREFAGAPDFQSLYYVADGHPRPAGHAVLAAAVQQALLSEPAFVRCTRVVSKP